jgi:N-acetyltransferase 10
MLSEAKVRARPNVLWCFSKKEKELENRKLQKKVNRAKLDLSKEDPFELFVASTNIRHCYYRQTDKILGQTFGMCVLQDFESLTPNILARTIETVEGGGVVVVLLKTVDSLKQLFAMSMDVHARYRTEAHQEVVGRFNERFILSLASNKSCIVIDEKLKILPISSHVKNLAKVPKRTAEDSLTKEDADLRDIKEKFVDSQPTGCLLNLCKTLDQAKALLEFIDAITDKKLDRTVSLTAARGRGKSAALGLAVAAAVGFGYSNIFVTSPTPENLGTLFDFVFKAFDAMKYEEHTDYDLVQSTNPEFNNAIVRVNVHEQKAGSSSSLGHRQTIQYLHPSDAQKLGQAELVVIDEAAAIPLPTVKQLLGPYLVFMSSTINGYEGTGRSLSLKLLEQLRKQSSATSAEAVNSKSTVSYRGLREVTLDESIRYKPGDAVESWLNRLLCLDATAVPALNTGCPLPKDCDLYYVNRDTLFSYHKASEAFLQRIVSLFVSSHYKNSPNDLQMMSDAPAHHVFCLLGSTEGGSLPEVLCVIQVSLAGIFMSISV